MDQGMSEATTEGICVVVHSEFSPEQSFLAFHRFVYQYHVMIENQSSQAVQLRRRHWVVTDGHGGREVVNGPGVRGEQPWIQPGESYSYNSLCILRTPIGSMHGAYEMDREDGTKFDAEIKPFTLCAPEALN